MRLPMPGAMPAEIAERDSDVGGDFPRNVMDQARQDLIERFHDGKAVGRLTLRDLIDSDMNGPRAGFAAIELTNLVLADSLERAALADKYVEGVIERYLESKDGEIEIEDRAAEIFYSEPEYDE